MDFLRTAPRIINKRNILPGFRVGVLEFRGKSVPTLSYDVPACAELPAQNLLYVAVPNALSITFREKASGTMDEHNVS